MSTTPRTNTAGRENDGRGQSANRNGASGRSVRGRISAALARTLRRTGPKIEPNPRPISREVDF